MNTAQNLYSPYSTSPIPDLYEVPERIESEQNSDSSTRLIVNKENITEAIQATTKHIPKINVALPFSKPLPGKFQLLQLWEGRITQINNEDFSAIIVDKTHPEFNDELVTIDIEEITPAELSLLQIGAVFYWSIGYADYPGRGRSRESKIRFRRLPGWTKKELNRAIESGKKLAAYFD
ncbi:MAG: hypothetical protein KKD44_13165 [Proteobacteria bacterium]|nr:hypothetical protein [Pseudomonadota bacterium]